MEWARVPSWGAGSCVEIKSWCAEPDTATIEQISDAAAHPAVFHHVALMPDAHSGYGLPIGGVAAFAQAVVPYAVGMDIGCGMRSLCLDIPARDFDADMLKALREDIAQRIPHGLGKTHDMFTTNFCPSVGSEAHWALDFIPEDKWRHINASMGTLGAGNHFIELQAGDDGLFYIMVHSGSRQLGGLICKHYHDIALGLNKQWKTGAAEKLSHFPFGNEFYDKYMIAMEFALNYAHRNREYMMNECAQAVAQSLGVSLHIANLDEIDIHHNYATIENHFGKNVVVHRKGATSAKRGEKGIIPGDMGSQSYIVQGLGNEDSFMSCAHGAGRAMSRTQAKKTLNASDEKQAMSDSGIIMVTDIPLDEAGNAYKDIGVVMAAQRDLVQPLVTLTPLIQSIKG